MPRSPHRELPEEPASGVEPATKTARSPEGPRMRWRAGGWKGDRGFADNTPKACGESSARQGDSGDCKGKRGSCKHSPFDAVETLPVYEGDQFHSSAGLFLPILIAWRRRLVRSRAARALRVGLVRLRGFGTAAA